MKAAFLDRDGVINYDYGYVYKFENFRFCKGIFKGLKTLIELDFSLIIITNQSGIARGIFTEEEYKKTTNLMLNKLKDNNIKITQIYHCPHHPSFPGNEFSECSCRKPKPGLFLKAAKEHNIEMQKSIAIGDSERDLIAARSAGIKKRYLIRKDNSLEKQNLITSTHKSLLECANTIKNFKENLI
tara:strand:+ start:575 stop:1129 length:555 start_codon:yes stop_codon:yes gene_type:complete